MIIGVFSIGGLFEGFVLAYFYGSIFQSANFNFYLKATPTHAPPHDFCRHKNSLVERALAT